MVESKPALFIFVIMSFFNFRHSTIHVEKWRFEKCPEIKYKPAGACNFMLLAHVKALSALMQMFSLQRSPVVSKWQSGA